MKEQNLSSQINKIFSENHKQQSSTRITQFCQPFPINSTSSPYRVLLSLSIHTGLTFTPYTKHFHFFDPKMAPLTYLAVSISLLMVPAFAAADNGSPEVTITTATDSSPATATAAGWDDWQTVVTWPAGCESWANPCPSGAHVAGGGKTTTETATGTASYENGFTSYTTMTDANGVITGMPSKATIPAGVIMTQGTTLVTAVKSAVGNSSFTSKTPSQSGVSPLTTTFPTSAASQVRALGSAAFIAALSVIVALS
jgi:hypothetical protein